MTPDSAETHDAALEALIAASLRVPDKESELADEDISRYLDQCITLSSEDEAALEKSKAKLIRKMKRVLQPDKTGKTDDLKPVSVIAKLELPASAGPKQAPEEFVEAVLIAQLTRLHSTPEHPLGRKRCQKLVYLSHRKAEDDVQLRFLKKAAGPYSPWARYKGPEKIALKNGYVKRAKVGKFEGLVVGDKIAQIDVYLPRYPVCRAVSWAIESFRFRKNDELELLTTVDFAALDLKKANNPITLDAIRRIIATNREWSAKLKREVFSDINIARILDELQHIFPATYEGHRE